MDICETDRSFVRGNRPESEFTREIARMVQEKKFEQSFLNEYFAWNLHDQDIMRRGRAEGRAAAYIELVKSGVLSLKDAAAKLGVAEGDLRAQL